MKIQKQHRMFFPLLALSAVIIIAAANILYVQSTQAISLSEVISSLLGKNSQEKPTVNPSETAPAQTQPSPSNAPATSTPSTTVQAQQQAAQSTASQAQSTVTNNAPASSTINTAEPVASTNAAAAALATADAQAQKTDSSVQYSSARISDDKRDRLYAVAGSVAIIGAALYSMTLLQTASRRELATTTRRPLYIK